MEYWLVYTVADGAQRMKGSSTQEGASSLVQLQAGERLVLLTEAMFLQSDLTPFLGELGLALWDVAKGKREAAISAGVTTPYGVFQTDEVSRVNIVGATLAAVIATIQSQPFEITWTLLDNTTVALDATEMISVGLLAVTYVAGLHENARAIRTALEAATTVEDLLMVDVLDGWS